MKSAIFESLNDRSNITNAYMRMVNEANEEMKRGIAEISAMYDDKEYPLCIYNYDATNGHDEEVVDLADIEMKYKPLDYYEPESDEYFIAKAFEDNGLDELYKKVLAEEPELYMTPEQAYSSKNGFIYTMKDVLSVLRDIGNEKYGEEHGDEIDVAIPSWAAYYYNYGDDSALSPEDKKMADSYIEHLNSQGYDLVPREVNMGFVRRPEFGDASDCYKFAIVKRSVSESTEDGEDVEDGPWFDEQYTLVRDLPNDCVKECTLPGVDAYEACKKWVNKLGFTNGLDIAQAKGYLKETGAWDDDELASFSDEETAIRLLWILCGDALDGSMILSMGDAKPFNSGVSESTYTSHKVALTNIEWPYSAYDSGFNLPGRESMTVEVMDNESLENAIKGIYMDSYGVAPVKFRIARDVNLGSVHVDDDKPRRRKNEVVSQTDVDKLKKKNPNLKDISEQR